jgi:uncharacterized protein YndB with AHSA1/START domain
MTTEPDRPVTAATDTAREGATDGMSIRTEGLDVVATRTFEAPRATVFRAWSDCDALVHWWGPKGWTLPVCDMDFRVGGSWFYCMRSPAGEQSCGRSSYREIVEPERIVYTDAFAEPDGSIMREMPEMTITVEFAEADRRTTVTSRSRFASAADLKVVLDTGMESGLTETWDRLAAYLADTMTDGSRA